MAYKYLLDIGGLVTSPHFQDFRWRMGDWHTAANGFTGIHCFANPCQPMFFPGRKDARLRLAVVTTDGNSGGPWFPNAVYKFADYRRVRLDGWFTGNLHETMPKVLE